MPLPHLVKSLVFVVEMSALEQTATLNIVVPVAIRALMDKAVNLASVSNPAKTKKRLDVETNVFPS